MSAKQGICKWSVMRKNKYGCQVHMYITAELKAYWLTYFIDSHIFVFFILTFATITTAFVMETSIFIQRYIHVS